MLTNEEIFAKDKSDYLPVFARYNIVLDHGDGPYVYCLLYTSPSPRDTR